MIRLLTCKNSNQTATKGAVMGVVRYDRPDRKSPFGVKWTENGRRRFKFFLSKADRDAFMSGLKKAADRQGRAILEMSAGEALIWRECVRKAGSAAGVLRAVDAFSLVGGHGDVLLAAARQEFLDEKLNVGMDEKYRTKLEDVLKKLDRLGRRAVADLSGEDARRWAAGLGLAPVTVQTHIKVCRSFWAWMVRRGYVRENVFSTVAMPVVVESEPGFLSVEQTESLFRAAVAKYPDAVAYFALGAFAGLRSSAATRLEWREHIRFEQRGILITAENAKNRRRQFVDGHEGNLWDWLEWARDHAPGGFELPDRQWNSLRGKVAKEAGVVMPHNALRHSFCTYHCALFGDAGRTATLLTHRGNVSILYEHYKGNATRPDAERYFGIRPPGEKPRMARTGANGV
jgi:site-specific recombinase XerD